jgi:hypothetical protein
MRREDVRPLLERVSEDLPEPDLTDTSWSRGLALRRRHHRTTVLTALLAVLVVAAVVIALSVGGVTSGLVPPDRGPTEPPGYVPPSGQINGMDFWTAPPGGSEAYLNRLETPLGDLLRLPDQATSLSSEPIDEIAAVVLAPRSGGYEPLVLGRDGLWSRTDMLLAPIATGLPLDSGAISPDGRMAAFPQPGHVALVDATTAQVRRFSLPQTDIRGVSWLPDADHLLASGPRATYRVLVGPGETGEETVTRIEPSKNPADATAPYRLNGAQGQVTMERYGTTGWYADSRVALPATSWVGQTFSTDDVVARLFIATPMPQIRTVASVPQVIAALSTAEQVPSRLLVLGETPSKTAPPPPTPSQPVAVRTAGCCFLLGWYDDHTALFQVTGWVLAWDLQTGQVRRVTELDVSGVAIGPGVRG